jgi:hypothetical protein
MAARVGLFKDGRSTEYLAEEGREQRRERREEVVRDGLAASPADSL